MFVDLRTEVIKLNSDLKLILVDDDKGIQASVKGLFADDRESYAGFECPEDFESCDLKKLSKDTNIIIDYNFHQREIGAQFSLRLFNDFGFKNLFISTGSIEVIEDLKKCYWLRGIVAKDSLNSFIVRRFLASV